jgi:hypothetical protein
MGAQSCRHLPQRGFDLGMIAERMNRIADNLAALVAFAGD